MLFSRPPRALLDFLSNNIPLVESGSGSPGSGPKAARDDHVHPDGGGGGGGGASLSDDTPLIESGLGDAGTSSEAARSDHVHPQFGGTGAPTNAPYLTDGPDATLSAERNIQALGAALTMRPSADNITPLRVKRFSITQSANLFQVLDEADAILASLDANGALKTALVSWNGAPIILGTTSAHPAQIMTNNTVKWEILADGTMQAVGGTYKIKNLADPIDPSDAATLNFIGGYAAPINGPYLTYAATSGLSAERFIGSLTATAQFAAANTFTTALQAKKVSSQSVPIFDVISDTNVDVFRVTDAYQFSSGITGAQQWSKSNGAFGFGTATNHSVYVYVNGNVHLEITDTYSVWDKPALFGGTAFVSSPAACALVEEQSTTKGHLFARMTTTQRNAIGTPLDGLFLYDSSVNAFSGRANGSFVYMVQSNGTVAFTANQSMGSHRLTNLAAPSASTDAISLGEAQKLGQVAVLCFGNSLSNSGVGTTYGDPWFGARPSTASMLAIEVPEDGFLKNLRIRTAPSGAPVGDDVIFTVFINGSPTSLQVILGDGNEAGADITHTVAVTQADRVSLEQVGGALLSSGAVDYTASIEYVRAV